MPADPESLTTVTAVAGTQQVEVLRRRARRALALNLVVAICFFGLISVPAAIVAGQALRALPADPPRAQRLIRWSWALMATNLMFYLLLLAVILTVTLFVFLAARSGA